MSEEIEAEVRIKKTIRWTDPSTGKRRQRSKTFTDATEAQGWADRFSAVRIKEAQNG